MKNSLLTLSVIAIISFSCASKDSSEIVYDAKFDVPTLAVAQEYKTLTDKNTLLTRPFSMLIADSLIILYDPVNQDKIIQVFNRYTGEDKGRLIHMGRGPGEIITTDNPTYDAKSGEIIFVDKQNNKLLKYNIEKSLQQSKSVFSEQSFGRGGFNAFSAYSFNDTYLITSYSTNLRLGYIEGDSLKTLTSNYPKLVLDDDENRSIWAYSVRMMMNPKRTKMVATTYIGAVLEILDISNLDNIVQTKLVPITAPVYSLAEGAKPAWVTPSESTVFGFHDTYVSDNFIYTILDNFADKFWDEDVEYQPEEYGQNSILVFDWQGEAVCTIKLPRNIFCLAIDELSNKIYAIGHSKEGDKELVEFDFDFKKMKI